VLRALGAVLVVTGIFACTPAQPYGAPPASTYSVAAFEIVTPSFTDRVAVATVAPEFAGASKVRPHLGRFFLPADHQRAAPAVIAISRDLWETRFNSDPATIGRIVRLNGADVVIIGVLPRDFTIPQRAVIWAPRKN
jgi:hypothetical protein